MRVIYCANFVLKSCLTNFRVLDSSKYETNGHFTDMKKIFKINAYTMYSRPDINKGNRTEMIFVF